MEVASCGGLPGPNGELSGRFSVGDWQDVIYPSESSLRLMCGD
jgi:hypothetical protein